VPALATEIQSHAHTCIFSLAQFFCKVEPFQEESMNMWPISLLHIPGELGQRLMSSQMEEDLEQRSPCPCGYSSPLRAGGRAGTANLPGGERQQVSLLSSHGSFSLSKPREIPLDETPWASTEASFVKGSEKKQKTPRFSALPKDRPPQTCPEANSRCLPRFKEKSCGAYRLQVYFDRQVHRHLEKPHFGHRCVSAFVHLA